MSEFFLGPFGPVIGYSLALVNVGFLLRTLATGRVAGWRPPADASTGGIVRVASVINVVGIVVIWLSASPGTLRIVVLAAVISAVCLLVAFLSYRHLVDSLTVKDAHNQDFLGGIRLNKAAQAKVDNGVSVQALFKGAQFHPDRLWSTSSLAWSRTIVTFLLIALMSTGTVALSCGGFATQVTLTNKAAASVIDVKDAPGSDTGNAAVGDLTR